MLPKSCFRQPLVIALTGFYLLLLSSCQNSYHDIPFPENITPVIEVPSDTFKLVGQKSIDWIKLNADSLKQLMLARPFSLSALPGSKLNVAAEIPMPAPPDEKTFSWDTTVHFDLNSIPEKKFRSSISVLGVPKRLKSEMPKPTDNSSENILVFGQEQGLPDLNVNSIVEDKSGNIWMATANGICVFDGSSTLVYTQAQGLSNNYYDFLCADGQGRIWAVSHANRIDIIDRERSTVEHIELGNVWRIAFDDDGKALLTAEKEGMIVLDPVRKTIRYLGKGVGIKSLTRAITRFSDGSFWMFGDQSFYRMDLKKGTNQILTDTLFFGNNPDCYTIAEDKNGVAWPARTMTIFCLVSTSRRTSATGSAVHRD